jgi:hypothetical protein
MLVPRAVEVQLRYVESAEIEIPVEVQLTVTVPQKKWNHKYT